MTEANHQSETKETTQVMKLNLKPKNILIGAVFMLIIMLAIGVTVYFYLQNKKLEDAIRNPGIAAQEESKTLLDKLAKHLILPVGETPTIATVSDKDKLKDQPFFSKAKNGDKVIIYAGAKKAILYDPVSDKIIDVTTININNTIASASATPATNLNLKVSIYNGTNTSGLTQSAEKDLKSKITNIEITSKENASNKDYEKTLVIDLTGDNKTEVAEVAKAIGGLVSPMPAAEKKPNGDLLIILGSDYVKQ